MRKEYKIIQKSYRQNFFLTFYLLIKFFIDKKIHNKKKKESSYLTYEYKDFIKKNLKLSEDWFTHNLNSLNFFFKKNNLFDKKIKMLEIGSFEGNSSVFFLKYFKNIELTCVDTFKGSAEHENYNSNYVYNNFLYNTKSYSDKIKIFKSSSKKFFLDNHDKGYDLIYIDGSHKASDVFEDATNSFKILNKNGFIIFDDFLWDIFPSINDNPIGGIKKFIKKNFFKIKIKSIDYQLIVKKL